MSLILRRKVDALIHTYCANLTKEERVQFIHYQIVEGQSLTKVVVADVTD